MLVVIEMSDMSELREYRMRSKEGKRVSPHDRNSIMNYKGGDKEGARVQVAQLGSYAIRNG